MGCVATSRCNPLQLSYFECFYPVLSALMVASAKGIDGDLNKDCTCLTGLSRILSGVTKERFGDPDRTRTCYLKIRNLALYPDELRGLFVKTI
jgi:hypothetical protein